MSKYVLVVEYAYEVGSMDLSLVLEESLPAHKPTLIGEKDFAFWHSKLSTSQRIPIL